MQLGMVGLGRMGANMVRRLMRDGHACVVYDVNPDAVAELAGEGADGRLLARRPGGEAERAPRGLGDGAGRRDHREDASTSVAAVLDSGDAIIDGGNSYYRDDIRRATRCASSGIDYVDCGTSGGVFGLDRGYCLMIGGAGRGRRSGSTPIFASLAPGVDVGRAHAGAQR